MRTTLQLIKQECANHENKFNGITDYCCLENTEGYRCKLFLDESVNCYYFEDCVLPLDPQREALYCAERDALQENRELTAKEIKMIKEESKTTKPCKKCKQEFQPTSNRQKYCNKCKKENAKENQKKWVKEKRKN